MSSVGTLAPHAPKGRGLSQARGGGGIAREGDRKIRNKRERERQRDGKLRERKEREGGEGGQSLRKEKEKTEGEKKRASHRAVTKPDRSPRREAGLEIGVWWSLQLGNQTPALQESRPGRGLEAFLKALKSQVEKSGKGRPGERRMEENGVRGRILPSKALREIGYWDQAQFRGYPRPFTPSSDASGWTEIPQDRIRGGARGREEGEDPAFSRFFFSSQLGRFNGAKELVKS